MTAAALLRSVVAALDAAGVPFMLTGSLAAAYHGAGRSTMDIDVVIDPTTPQLHALVRAFAGAGTYVSSEAMLAKLEWAKLGASARQIEDVAALLRVRAQHLDREYLEHWITALGLTVQWTLAIRGGGESP